MKKLLRSIEAMSIINPQLCSQLTIQAEVEQSGEGPIPHIHVYHDKSRKTCSYVRLDIAEYSTHHRNQSKLSKKLLNQLITLLRDTWTGYIIKTPSGYRLATGYEAAVYIWADTYENDDLSKFNLDENGELIMPDYSKLK